MDVGSCLLLTKRSKKQLSGFSRVPHLGSPRGEAGRRGLLRAGSDAWAQSWGRRLHCSSAPESPAQEQYVAGSAGGLVFTDFPDFPRAVNEGGIGWETVFLCSQPVACSRESGR